VLCAISISTWGNASASFACWVRIHLVSSDLSLGALLQGVSLSLLFVTPLIFSMVGFSKARLPLFFFCIRGRFPSPFFLWCLPPDKNGCSLFPLLSTSSPLRPFFSAPRPLAAWLLTPHLSGVSVFKPARPPRNVSLSSHLSEVCLVPSPTGL